MGQLIEVLYVDDDPSFTNLAATFLEREEEQLDVHTATSPDAGLERLNDHEFDCIVADYRMPGTDGIQFLEAVREEYPDLPFILYTGRGSEDVASEAISAGATDYLQKGTPDQYTVLANRVTSAVEQFQSQRALENTERRLSLFIEQSSLGVIEWNEEFEVVRANETAEDILGYSEEELRGNSWELLVPESEQGTIDDIVRELLEDRGGYHSVNENVRKDGERIVCEWHNRVVTDETGDVVAIFSQFDDITAQKERERELKRQNERLEEFASVVSHDLRNPLSVADAHLELASDECDSDHLDRVSRAHDRMAELIDDLLTLAREDDQTAELTSVELQAVADTCWDNVDTASATCVIDTERAIRADERALKRLFENLFRNAVEHGGEDVTVRVGALEDGFYIEDDGSGIAHPEREEVFDTSSSTSAAGHGFGLSIVSRVVDAHDWTVRATEGSAGGARFEVTDVEFDDTSS